MNDATQARTVGRDSVEPKNLPVRHNPDPGVHILGDRTTIAFLTVCSFNRGSGLAIHEVHTALIDAWNSATSWLVGAYVVMPDHLHLFCAPQTLDISIEHWITFWKRQFRRQYTLAPRFQSRGFHHRLREGDNYGAKWDYVRSNPVRAGLVTNPDDWPFQGILNNLPWW